MTNEQYARRHISVSYICHILRRLWWTHWATCFSHRGSKEKKKKKEYWNRNCLPAVQIIYNIYGRFPVPCHSVISSRFRWSVIRAKNADRSISSQDLRLFLFKTGCHCVFTTQLVWSFEISSLFSRKKLRTYIVIGGLMQCSDGPLWTREPEHQIHSGPSLALGANCFKHSFPILNHSMSHY